MGSLSSVVCMPFAGKPEAAVLGTHLVYRDQKTKRSGTIVGGIFK